MPASPSGGQLSTAVPQRYRGLVNAAASSTGLPQQVIAAQIDDESGWNPQAVSPTGAEGIAQFEPGTWKTWGKGSPFSPDAAFPAYSRFMDSLLSQYHGNIRDALAAYNAGPGNISAGYGYADTILAAAGEPAGAVAGKGTSGGTGGNLQDVYKNPLRDAQQLVPERVDMGVDYSARGPIYALGPGTITNVYNSGWPGGTFISERLSKGPAAGRYVYSAENITPSVQVGQQVTADTQIGTITGGIETGWAEPPGTGWALGRHQFTGSNATAYGVSYSELLHKLGAPAGVVSGPVSGSAPSWIQQILQGLSTTVNPLAGGAGGAAGGALGGLSGIAGGLTSIGDAITAFEQGVAWFFVPGHWVRIFAGAGGMFLTGLGIATMARTGRGYSIDVGGAIPAPAAGGQLAPALGIAEVTMGAILLFIAFHNLPASVTNFPTLLGYFADAVQGRGQQQAAGS